MGRTAQVVNIVNNGQEVPAEPRLTLLADVLEATKDIRHEWVRVMLNRRGGKLVLYFVVGSRTVPFVTDRPLKAVVMGITVNVMYADEVAVIE